jgi:hypothetical protein
MGRNLGNLPTQARRLASKGWSAFAISKALRLPLVTVRAILTVPPKPAPATVESGWSYCERKPVPFDLVELPPPPIAAAEALEQLGEQRVVQLGDDQAAAEMTTTRPPAADWGSVFGRGSARGSRNGRAATDETTAAEIRELRAEGLQRDELAAMFGVSVATITRITSGRSYTDLPPPPIVDDDDDQADEPPAIVAAVPPPAAATDRSGWDRRDNGARR